MLSTKSLPFLQDLTWELPPLSHNLSQGNLNPFTTSGVPQSPILQSCDSIHTLSTNLPQTSTLFSNDDQRYPQSEDLEMEEEADAQLHVEHPAGHHSIPKAISTRSKYSNLDWDSHKEELRRLYLEENQNLDNTMRIMKERHSFPES